MGVSDYLQQRSVMSDSASAMSLLTVLRELRSASQLRIKLSGS